MILTRGIWMNVMTQFESCSQYVGSDWKYLICAGKDNKHWTEYHCILDWNIVLSRDLSYWD